MLSYGLSQGTAVKVTAKNMYYLEYIISWFDICNVNPLAVNIMSVGIPATHCDTLVTKVCTLISLLNAYKTM